MALDFSGIAQQPNWMGLVTAGMDARRKFDAHQAFGQLVTNPQDQSAFARLAGADPETAYKFDANRQKVARETETRNLTVRAAQGDRGASQQLAGFDNDAWARIDTSQRAQIKRQTETVGQLALMADTPEKWAGALQQANSLGVDVSNYQDFATREAVLAEAGLVKEHLDRLEPKYITPGEQGMVNVRDPAALRAYQASLGGSPGLAPAPAPSPATAGIFAVTGLPGERITSGYRDPAHNARVGGVPNSFHTRRDAQGNPLARDSVPPSGMDMGTYAAQIRQRNPSLHVINEGDHVHAEPGSTSRRTGITKAQFDALPSGATFKAPDGSLRRKP